MDAFLVHFIKPLLSICYHALLLRHETIETIEKQLPKSNYVIALIEERLEQATRSA